VPPRPKCPNVRGELRVPVQCGLFASRSSKPSPQSSGREARRREQLARHRQELAEPTLDAAGGGACEREAPHVLEVVAERHLGALADERGRNLEARVGVDATPTRLCDRRRVVRRQAGGVSEQVAKGRTRRPGGFVELDDAFLTGDEHRDGGGELRHGEPGEHALDVPVLRLCRTCDRDRDVLARPAVDLP